jgi:hypothetical protein
MLALVDQVLAFLGTLAKRSLESFVASLASPDEIEAVQCEVLEVLLCLPRASSNTSRHKMSQFDATGSSLSRANAGECTYF